MGSVTGASGSGSVAGGLVSPPCCPPWDGAVGVDGSCAPSGAGVSGSAGAVSVAAPGATPYQATPSSFQPTDTKHVVLGDVGGVVVRARDRVGVVLAVQRHAPGVVGVPAHPLVLPAHRHQVVSLGGGRRVVVVAGVGVVEAEDGRGRGLGCGPSHALVDPANRHQVVALHGARRVEVLA